MSDPDSSWPDPSHRRTDHDHGIDQVSTSERPSRDPADHMSDELH